MIIDNLRLFYATILTNKTRIFVFILIILSSLYRFYKWYYIKTTNVIPIAKFVKVDDNGTIILSALNIKVKVALKRLFIPIKNGKIECENAYFVFYKKAIEKIMQNNQNIGIMYDSRMTNNGDVIVNGTDRLSQKLIDLGFLNFDNNINLCIINKTLEEN